MICITINTLINIWREPTYKNLPRIDFRLTSWPYGNIRGRSSSNKFICSIVAGATTSPTSYWGPIAVVSALLLGVVSQVGGRFDRGGS